MKVTLSQQATAAEDVLFQEVGGESVLLNLASESYFGLDAVGTRIWQLLAEDPALSRAHGILCEEYDAEPARLESDLLELVARLSEAGLVQVA